MFLGQENGQREAKLQTAYIDHGLSGHQSGCHGDSPASVPWTKGRELVLQEDGNGGHH